jgi:hypothetical protein
MLIEKQSLECVNRECDRSSGEPWRSQGYGYHHSLIPTDLKRIKNNLKETTLESNDRICPKTSAGKRNNFDPLEVSGFVSKF